MDFTITLTEAGLRSAAEKGLAGFFKLQTKLSTSNMMAFDKDGLITKYESPEQVLKDFFELRLEYYEKRRQHLLGRARNQLQRISNKVCPRTSWRQCCLHRGCDVHSAPATLIMQQITNKSPSQRRCHVCNHTYT